jgi:hypothetical protein
MPYINDDTQKTKIDNALSQAYKDISSYQQKIDNIRSAYRQQEQEHNRKMCAQCEIDIDKSEFAYNEEKKSWLLPGTYTESNPGKIVMKNGDKHTFYVDSDGKWYISSGLFSSHTFKDTKEMITYFLNECEKRYCK